MTTRPVIDLAVYESGTGTITPIEGKSLRVSYDLDRSPFVMVDATLDPVSDAVWAKLDPRDPAGTTRHRFMWWVYHYDQAGAETGALQGNAVLRRRRRSLDGEVGIDAAGFESLLDDKRRVATNTVNTGATNLFNLALWAVTDVAVSHQDVPAAITDGTGASGVAIPAGDRRLWLQGESLADLYEAELAATGRRLRAAPTGAFWITLDDTAPTGFGAPANLYLYDGDAGTIHTFEHETDRDAWGNAVLLKFDYTNPAGTRVTAYQIPTGGGANSKARMVTYERPAPSGSLADQVTNRDKIRGETFTIVADADPTAYPGQTLTASVGGVKYVGSIRSVEFTYPEATMTIKAQVA